MPLENKRQWQYRTWSVCQIFFRFIRSIFIHSKMSYPYQGGGYPAQQPGYGGYPAQQPYPAVSSPQEYLLFKSTRISFCSLIMGKQRKDLNHFWQNLNILIETNAVFHSDFRRKGSKILTSLYLTVQTVMLLTNNTEWVPIYSDHICNLAFTIAPFEKILSFIAAFK